MENYNADYLEKLQLKILETEFEKRKEINPSYSLRKFAEEAEIDSSIMSKYLKRKRKLTPEAFNVIIKKIRFDSEVLDQYEQALQKYTLLGEKHNKIKSHWYYHGILEAIELFDFKPDMNWIAKKIDLPLQETEKAINDLLETGALEISDGVYKNTMGNTTFIEDPNMDELAGRSYQKGLLDKAHTSIEQMSGELKDHTSLCIAFDSSLMLEVKKRIDDFRSEIGDFIEKNSRNCDDIYALQINFNSLTDKLKKKEED